MDRGMDDTRIGRDRADAMAHLQRALEGCATVYGQIGSTIVRIHALAPNAIEVTTFGLFGTIERHHESLDGVVDFLCAENLLPNAWEHAGEPQPPILLPIEAPVPDP